MGVAGGGRKLVVPQQHLDNPDIDTVLEQVRGEAVAQRIDADALDEAGGLARRSAGGMKPGSATWAMF